MKKYQVIYADPPWQYRVWGKEGQRGCAQTHYPTMTLQALKSLPVDELAAQDCALFLWVTFPVLFEAKELLNAWGFQYKTIAFVWVKKNKKADSLFVGMGHWTRANAELCILAIRGHPKRVSKSVRQVILSPIEAHSKKPDEARKRIEELFGNVPRIELFARQQVPGWDVWGNEVESTTQILNLSQD